MKHPNGLFGWVDLSSSDVEVARDFYQRLFGWTSEDTPTPFGPAYTTFYKDGKRVAGLTPQSPELSAAGVPSAWNSYVLVESADDAIKAAEAAGGAVVVPAMDVMSEGRMALIADPSGGVVGLWQPMDHQGADLFNAPGALAWNELQSRDWESAKNFYNAVFGWRYVPMEGADYVVGHVDAKKGDDTSNCGLMPVPPGVPDQMPSTWMVYFAVADCDTSLAEAEKLGGKIVMPGMDMGPGRFGGIADPTGATVFMGSFPSS
ncbi:MAG TPA: VOC family protein [Actinomycetes bacterium]|nr:VOC family protein [Actinomycetes bacterium]